ncbi:META domain-containing protein, partial [Burkholderia pseudomallei]|nr:META domain-containing protein [Burkholderia pseudomallei]MCW0149988.1 META domain-containing protein [Burkholderia pseudomallei]
MRYPYGFARNIEDSKRNEVMFNSSAAARMRLRIARSLRAPLGALTVAALLAACTMPTHPDSGAP